MASSMKQDRKRKRLSYNSRLLDAAYNQAMKPPVEKAERRQAKLDYIDSLPEDHLTKLKFNEAVAYRKMVSLRGKLRRMNIATHDQETIVGVRHDAQVAMEDWHAASMAYKRALSKTTREPVGDLVLVKGEPKVNKPLITSMKGTKK